MKLKLHLATVLFFVLSITSFAQTSDKEAAARQWIKTNEKELNIKPYHTLKLGFVRKGESGETLRFYQYINDVQVIDAEILVHFSPSNDVTSTASTFNGNISNINVNPSISKEAAIAFSDANLRIEGGHNFQEAKLFVTTIANETKLVYKVITNPNTGNASWETLIDAQTGAVLSVKDVAIYHHERNNSKKHSEPNKNQTTATPLAFVPGTAMVYTPDPLSQAQAIYGATGYADGNDANTTQLANARTAVVLPEIDLTAGVYKLKSSYAEIKDFEAPTTGLFTQATSAFNFTRDNNAFEAVNVFYHLDLSLRYINETLGIVCRPLLNAGVLQFDPSGLNGDDNSHYLPSSDQLAFGEGGVDDAEDADVIWHEFGHGVHDWITNGSSSQVNGLGEGSGDYWAQSYSRSLNQWPTTNAAYHYMFSWDGHNPFWDGRITNYTALYPAGLTGAIHTDGQIWATALMKIWDAIGREKTDKAFINGLDLTNSSTNQQNAAIAVRTAAMDMNYPCADITTITQKFTQAGYTMPTIALRMNAIANQTVVAGAGNTYTLPSYATLANPINTGCNATLTQSPIVGTVLAPGDHLITMTATSGASSVVRTFTLTITPTLAVNEIVKNNVVIFPNPAANVVTIKGEFDSNESIAIYNLLGQKVIEKTSISNEQNIDVSKLATGVYTIYFNTAKASYKFVKE